jgi:DNA-directed RNA polymerase alpha subunit
VTEFAAKTQELTETVGRLVSLIEQRGDDVAPPMARRPGGATAAEEEAVAYVALDDPRFLTKVDALELSVRSAAILKQANIVYIGDLVQMTEADLLRRPNSGRRSLNEIKEMLAQMGLHLGMDVPDWPPADLDELAQRLEEHH